MNALKRWATHTAMLLAFVALLGMAWNSAHGQPPGRKHGADQAMRTDMEVFHFLLDNRGHILRTVRNLDNGVQTVTESDKPEITKKIQEHVEAMHKRVQEGKGIHLRDPLFAAIFQQYDKVSMKVERIAKGVKVTETSTDPHVARLIQEHAQVVSKFIANGYEEVRRNHPVPDRNRQ